MNRCVILFCVFVWCTGSVLAQKTKPFTDRDKLNEDAQLMLNKSANAIDSLSSSQFIAAISSNAYSEKQQEQIWEICRQMQARNFKQGLHFAPFLRSLGGLYELEGVAGPMTDSLLMVAGQFLKQTNAAYFAKYVSTVDGLVNRKALYYARYNKLLVEGATITFSYVGKPEAIEYVPPIEEEKLQDTNDDSDWFSDWSETNTSTDNWDSWDEPSEQVFDDTPVYVTEIDMPELNGPIITIKNANLWFITPYDSVPIRSTSGDFMPLNNEWVGNGGTFGWIPAGLSEDSVFVELSDYLLNVTKTSFTAEKVKLTNLKYLTEQAEGVFEFASRSRKSDAVSTYPRFKSYGNKYNIKGIQLENIVYTGGFSMMGQKVLSESLSSGLSYLEYHDAAQIKFRSASKRYIFQDSTITADRASIVLYHQYDSIYHPAINFRFDLGSKVLTLLSYKGMFKNTHFISSYFNMQFEADLIKWPVELDSMDISTLMARNRVGASFESMEFYDEGKLLKLNGLFPFNPLMLVVKHAEKNFVDEFYVNELSDAHKLDIKHVRAAMSVLWEAGFINYNPVNGMVTVYPMAYHYVNTLLGKKDYDDLQLSSRLAGKPNASFDLRSQEMTVRGVKRLDINRKLDVYIEPENQEIILLQNRNILFEGKVFAGNYKYIGKDFRFDYDSFLIRMNQIDSMKFNISDDPNSKSNSKLKRQLDNQLVETAGTLYINKPDNKSAKVDHPEYPIFNATKGATVYFIGKEVLNGAYDNSIYFTIPPFEIDSVSASDPSTIGFVGMFHSGNIFPEFEEVLKIMPDGALGFDHQVPANGYNVYRKNSKFYGNLKLDNGGLRGGEKLEHLTATLFSDNFVFFKDSVVGKGYQAEVRGESLNGTSYAQLTAKNHTMKWLTRKDSLYLRSIREPFDMYNQSATFRGNTLISPKGMYGAGILETRGSTARSRNFQFQENVFRGRHATFTIKSSNPEKPALSGNNVKLNFDLINSKAEINPEIEGTAAITFPYAQYKTSISRAVWDLDDKTVTMNKPTNVPIEKSYFYATRPDMDSLVFNATGAKYDINELKLNIFGIPFIKVADAKITPDKNEVLILENAALQKLENAKLSIDTLNGYHQLVEGEIDILSRKKFEGKATYRFVSSQKENYDIEFGAFALESVPVGRGKVQKLHTVAGGEVKDTDQLLISPGMYFKGKMTMRAYKKALELDGFVKLDLRNRPGYDTWIVYKSEAEQQEVIFDFLNSFTETGEKLNAGIHFESGTNSLYATFANDKRTPADINFMKPSGLLSFDAQREEFKIEDPKKASLENYSGTLFAYNDNTGDLRFEGPLSFIDNKPKFINLKAAGSGKGNIESNEYTFNTMLSLQYNLPNTLVDAIGRDLQESVDMLGPPEANNDLNALLYKIANVLGENQAKAYEARSLQDYTPLNTISGEFMKSIVLSDLNLAWSEKERAWHSTGKVGLSNIGRHDINSSLEGFVEIRKNLSGESVYIFVQLSSSIWYYLGYEEGRMLLFSSNKKLNNLFASKSNSAKAKIGEFVYLDGDMESTLGFINRFRKTYLDIDVPYLLDEPSTPEQFNESAPIADDKPGKKPTPANKPVVTDDDDGF